MTTNETTVGGTAGRLSTKGRDSRTLFVDRTLYKLSRYSFHDKSCREFVEVERETESWIFFGINAAEAGEIYISSISQLMVIN